MIAPPMPNHASIALNINIAAFLLLGYELLWQSTGPWWDCHLAALSDGVQVTVIGTDGGDSTAVVRWTQRITACNDQEYSTYGPVAGPLLPLPTTQHGGRLKHGYKRVRWAAVYERAQTLPVQPMPSVMTAPPGTNGPGGFPI